MINHPICKTCAHFNPNSDEWDTPKGFGQCKLIQLSSDTIGWNKDYETSELLPKYQHHLATVMDGSSYMAELRPSPDFYCRMQSELMPGLIPAEGD
jgi:hypothetical protein